MSTSRISVDLNQRSFEIEVPDQNVESVLNLIGELFSKLSPLGAAPAMAKSKDFAAVGSPAPDADDQGTMDSSKSKKKRSGSKAGAKAKVPELIDLGLTPEQRIEMVEFFEEKAPKGQNDQVATLGVMLKKFLGKSEFNIDEMHSAFKVVQKATPRNLIAVFGNMKRDGKAGYSENQLTVNSYTEDHVSFHMKKEVKDA